MRGAEVPLRAPPPHPQACLQQWGRGSERKERVNPRPRPPHPPPPPPRLGTASSQRSHRPLFFPFPLVLLDCVVERSKNVLRKRKFGLFRGGQWGQGSGGRRGEGHT